MPGLFLTMSNALAVLETSTMFGGTKLKNAYKINENHKHHDVYEILWQNSMALVKFHDICEIQNYLNDVFFLTLQFQILKISMYFDDGDEDDLPKNTARNCLL